MVVLLLLCCRFVSFPNERMNSIFDPRLRRRDEWDDGRGWFKFDVRGDGHGWSGGGSRVVVVVRLVWEGGGVDG